jgi:SAM-dependent methyltransferase
MGLSSDYDAVPERYRMGMRTTQAYTAVSLYDRVATLLEQLAARTVVDVGCAEGALRAAVTNAAVTNPRMRLIGLDVATALLRNHPPPVIRADATRLPLRDGVIDVVTALNVLYHLPDPRVAIREARRVLRADGHLLAATIARDDSPELSDYWTRPATSFDAEDAPSLIGEVFDTVRVESWDAPLVTLPHRDAVRAYLLGRCAPHAAADAAARGVRIPLTVTKRGALIIAGR